MTLFWREELREAAAILAVGFILGWLLLTLVLADSNCTIEQQLWQVVSPNACNANSAAPDTLR